MHFGRLAAGCFRNRDPRPGPDHASAACPPAHTGHHSATGPPRGLDSANTGQPGPDTLADKSAFDLLGFEMPTKPLFLGGYAGRNYGHGIRQGFIPAAPGSAQGELRTIELTPQR